MNTHAHGRPQVAVKNSLTAAFKSPVIRTGGALVISSVSSSGLGALYWVIAAKRYPPAVVGAGASVVALMTLFASIANLGLKNGLLRFVPTSGPTVGRLILRAYSLTTLCALTIGSAFLVGVRSWSPQLSFLADGPVEIACFLLSLSAWGIFVLQDSVLVGMGRSAWVPIENVVFSVLKIALLLCFVNVSPSWSVLLSWSLPTVVLILIVNQRILGLCRTRRSIESSVASTVPAIPFRTVLRFSLSDQVASVCWIALLDGLPLLVLYRLGAEAAGHFYLPAQVAFGLYLVCGCVSAAFVAEGSRDLQSISATHRRARRLVLGLVVPAVAVVVVGAPVLLSTFGSSYEDASTTLLRLLALSALPYTYTSLRMARARVAGHLKTVITTMSSLLGVTVTTTLLLVDSLGLSGVGIAVLFGQTVVAVVLAGTSARPRGRVTSRLRVMDESIRVFERTLGALRSRNRNRSGLKQLHRCFSALGFAKNDEATAFQLLSARNDAVIARATIDGDQVIVKVATTEEGRAGLRAHAAALTEIHHDPRLDSLRSRLPAVIATGANGEVGGVLETPCHGVSAALALSNPSRRAEAFAVIDQCIASMHAATVTSVKIDDVRLKVLVDDPIARVLASIGSPSIEVRRGADALREELVAALGGRIVAFARVHGDLCAENVLLDEDAMNVAGIVDWECSRGQGLAVIDRMWFAMTLAAKASRCSIGELLVRTLRSDRPSDLFVGWLRCALPNESTDSIDARTACLLAWLNHVDSNLAKSTRYRGSKWWIAQNVTCVLRELVTTER